MAQDMMAKAKKLPAETAMTAAFINPKAKKLPAGVGGGLSIRCSVAWRNWVESGAKHCRTDISKLVDAALIDYLKARGFNDVAPER